MVGIPPLAVSKPLVGVEPEGEGAGQPDEASNNTGFREEGFRIYTQKLVFEYKRRVNVGMDLRKWKTTKNCELWIDK